MERLGHGPRHKGSFLSSLKLTPGAGPGGLTSSKRDVSGWEAGPSTWKALTLPGRSSALRGLRTTLTPWTGGCSCWSRCHSSSSLAQSRSRQATDWLVQSAESHSRLSCYLTTQAVEMFNVSRTASLRQYPSETEACQDEGQRRAHDEYQEVCGKGR